ncbi:ISAs1 family transposase [Streptomyces abyssomicinicus]|uniref:ISAs1 family transposase n=1 Tax=Streptomyces abyssomicinicus TaxID=574929 RepID=UPI001FEA845E|nr:ISAs1 family transposase [Streptomyces abyssomicinicus]
MPDPRERRGRWYSQTAILLVCACATVSGARSVDEIAEWAQRASGAVLAAVGIRRHPLTWRRAPSRTTIGRVPAAVDGDALDQAVGAFLAGRHDDAQAGAGQRRVIAVDGKELKGSARLSVGRRHLLAAVTHHQAVTLAQTEVDAKTNETAHFQPLLEPLDLDGALVTFDALHSVKANVTWLVEVKKAHYIAVIKANQATAHRQLADLPWQDVPSSTPPPPSATADKSPARSRRAASPTNSAASPSPTPASPSVSTDAANRPADARAARPSTPSPTSTPTRPPRPNSPPRSKATGRWKPCTMSKT